MPLEAGISKSQAVKLFIMVTVLLVVLVFNGKIKKCISAWRSRATGAVGSRSASTTRKDSSSATIAGGLSLSEISRILSETLDAVSLEKGRKAGQDVGLPKWPDRLERDIFNFQVPGESPPRPTSEALAVRWNNLTHPPSSPLYEGKSGSGGNEEGSFPEGEQEDLAKGAPPGFKLEATLTGGAPIAVINNQPIMIGQSISGYQLREIRDRQAVLTRNGQVIVLEIAQEGK